MISQSISGGKNCLKFTFSGYLSKQQATGMCHEWKALARNNKSGKYVVIFDAILMTDYEPMSRVIFQETITDLTEQIESIWVVTNSKLISAGAALMSLFTPFKLKSVTSESHITF